MAKLMTAFLATSVHETAGVARPGLPLGHTVEFPELSRLDHRIAC